MTEDVKVPDGTKSNPNPDGSGDKKEPKLYDENFVKELQTETIQRRKKIDELEAKIKAIEDEKLSDVEKKEKRIKELETEIANIKSSTKAKEIDNLILKGLSGKNVIDADTAMMLVRAELANIENVDDKAVTKAIDDVLKAKSFLISSGATNISSGNFAKKDNEPAKTGDKVLADFIGRHGK